MLDGCLKKKRFRLAWAPILALGLMPVFAAAPAKTGPAGLWKTIDDHTNRPRGIVEIYEQNGAFFGKIASALNPAEAKKRCSPCKGDRKDHPVIGLLIMRNMQTREDGEYDGGDILDPDTGMVYRCKMRLTDGGNKLIVRGYIGISLFGRSQVWMREP